MNRLPAQDTCHVCGTDLAAAFRAAGKVAERHALSRQIFNGICDPCQRDRYDAAVQYERAAHSVRLAIMLGAPQSQQGAYHPAIQQALFRVESADLRCIKLKMWPATRTTRRPSGYYREGS